MLSKTMTLLKTPLWRALASSVIGLGLWLILAPGGFKAFWAQTPLIAEIIREHNEVEQKTRNITIQIYTSFFPYLAGIAAGKEQPAAEKMDGYYQGQPYIFRQYYQKVAQMYPETDAGHYLLGYCEFYRGDPETARREWTKSIVLNPAFFWPYYNLAVMAFQEGDLAESAAYLVKGLNVDPGATLEALRQGGFYWQIWQHIGDPGRVIENNLNQGRLDALMMLAFDFMDARSFAQAEGIIKLISVQNTWHQQVWDLLKQDLRGHLKPSAQERKMLQQLVPVRLF